MRRDTRMVLISDEPYSIRYTNQSNKQAAKTITAFVWCLFFLLFFVPLRSTSYHTLFLPGFLEQMIEFGSVPPSNYEYYSEFIVFVVILPPNFSY